MTGEGARPTLGKRLSPRVNPRLGAARGDEAGHPPIAPRTFEEEVLKDGIEEGDLD